MLRGAISMTIYTHYLYWIHLPEHTDYTKEGYIGVTNNPIRRLNEHRNASKNRNDKNPYFGRILNKYKDTVIQTILISDTEENCYKQEELLRPKKNIGWNANKGGNKPPSKLGWKPNEATLKKRSASLKRIPRNEIWKKNLLEAKQGAKNGMYGKKIPCSETRALSISQSRKTTLDKYRLMSQEEFSIWVKSQNLHRKDGAVNSNVTRAILARSENPKDYYKN